MAAVTSSEKASIFAMELKKLFVNDIIRASCQTNVSQALNQTLQATQRTSLSLDGESTTFELYLLYVSG